MGHDTPLRIEKTADDDELVVTGGTLTEQLGHTPAMGQAPPGYLQEELGSFLESLE